MKQILVDLNFKESFDKPLVACIGYFDGLHIGHKALIDSTCALANQLGCESALITFSPDPWVTIKKLKNVQHLSTFNERVDRMEMYGIKNVIVLDFNEEMAAYSPEQFSTLILRKFPLKGLVCGFDFHYGLKGAGNCETLALENKAYFPLTILDSIDFEGEKISSSRIVQALEEANIELANKLLGYIYSIKGLVVQGRQLGRKIGFPTANIDYLSEYILPKPGIYIGMIEVKGIQHQAILNIGHNPTFNPRTDLSMEVFILDFNQDLYDQEVRVYFYKFLRNEIHFDLIEKLQVQLNEDVLAARYFFSQNH